jgi:hypothetical protein
MGCSIETLNSGAFRLYNGRIALVAERGRLVSLEHQGKEHLFTDPNLPTRRPEYSGKVVGEHLEMSSQAGPDSLQTIRRFYLGNGFLENSFEISELIRNESGTTQRVAPSLAFPFPTPAEITIPHYTDDRSFSLPLYYGGGKFSIGLNFLRRGLNPMIMVNWPQVLQQPARTLCLFIKNFVPCLIYPNGYPAEIHAEDHSFELGFFSQMENIGPGQESSRLSIRGVF